MKFRWSLHEHLALSAYAARWLFLAAPLGAAVGSACALFLWALERATQLQSANPWLLLLLPVAGVGIGTLYQRLGRDAEGGNNLLMDAIDGYANAGKSGDSGIVVPRRMAPLILVATVATHLFGGSAGREGTALQMGGSIASGLGRHLKLGPGEMRVLLMAGIAAGFSGIFGTPLAATVFALEVLAIGRIGTEALIPCLFAALASDWACAAWGAHHTHYAIAAASGGGDFNWILAGKVAVAAIAFGLASVLFAEATHSVGHVLKAAIKRPLLRPVAGGLAIIALTFALGTRDYLGLGVSSSDPHAVTILSCFVPGGAGDWSWWWKLAFTAVTLGSGFKGGEVTPLFFVGAALGNVLAKYLGAPADLFAGLGFIAVFAGATNTPLACTLMGIELFGSEHAAYFALACSLAYLASGHSGIYLSQRIVTPKLPVNGHEAPDSLRQARDLRPIWALAWPRKTRPSDDSEDADS